MRVHGFNSECVHYFPKSHEWILPAPRASGLRRQRQYGVPTLVETVVCHKQIKIQLNLEFETFHTDLCSGCQNQ
jgi:hypothetical protein